MDKPTTWRDETLRLLQNRPASLTLVEVSKLTGIPLPTIRLFARGKVKDPSVNFVEAINAFMKNYNVSNR